MISSPFIDLHTITSLIFINHELHDCDNFMSGQGEH